MTQNVASIKWPESVTNFASQNETNPPIIETKIVFAIPVGKIWPSIRLLPNEKSILATTCPA